MDSGIQVSRLLVIPKKFPASAMTVADETPRKSRRGLVPIAIIRSLAESDREDEGGRVDDRRSAPEGVDTVVSVGVVFGFKGKSLEPSREASRSDSFVGSLSEREPSSFCAILLPFPPNDKQFSSRFPCA